MNEATWDAETKNSTRYQFPGGLMQVRDEPQPIPDDPPTKSYLKPYVHSDHAWTGDQIDHTHSTTWDAESSTPSNYFKPLGALAQGEDEVHTKSYLEPYVHSDHAWTDN
jgi:hypothetical protein